MTKAKQKFDIYQTVTDQIVAQLEKGIAPWACPWDGAKTGSSSIACPYNPATGKRYSGVNVLLLWGAGQEKRFETGNWMTFKQAKELGGCVRKGEKGSFVVYASQFTPKDERQAAEQEDRKAREIGFMKQYIVFNIEQIDGLPADMMAGVGQHDTSEREIIEHAEKLMKATLADIRHGGDRAFYRSGPLSDYIQLPPQVIFHDQINYYRTAFHELGHWTGAERRLNRQLGNEFGSADYAKEELIAELSAAFTCASLSIAPTVRHADYIGSWLKVLKDDKRAIFWAASRAQKATDYILAFGEKIEMPTPTITPVETVTAPPQQQMEMHFAA